MKAIVVPTDFSDTALKALLFAGEIARNSGAVVHLLHVLEPDENRVWRPHVQEDTYAEAIAQERLLQLDTTRKVLLQQYPSVKINTELASGLVADAILDYAAQQQADLVLMGTTGASGMNQVFVGSVAARVIEKATLPVLTIPAAYEVEDPDRILLATNHFEQQTHIVYPLLQLVRLLNLRLYIAVFLDTDDAEPVDYINSGRQLDAYVHHLRKKYPDIDLQADLLEGRHFEEAVDAYIKREGIDFVAMVPYHKKFIDRILGRSTTRTMAYHSSIPLLTIPAQQLV